MGVVTVLAKVVKVVMEDSRVVKVVGIMLVDRNDTNLIEVC